MEVKRTKDGKQGGKVAATVVKEEEEVKRGKGDQGVRWAPFSVPRHRRLQTAAVLFWAIALPLFLTGFFLLCTLPPFWPVAITYILWITFDRAPEHGGRRWERARRWIGWKFFAGYYPIRLVKDCDIPPEKPYIFGYHPHGIISMGAFGNFATEATGFSQLFPGIQLRLLTLSSNFFLPVYRDFLLAHGMASVSKGSCQAILRKGPGHGVCIVIGGATESLSAFPGTADLTLRKRLGFIKIAVRTGASLVPVFSFGENDIFEQLNAPAGSRIHQLQKRFQAATGFTLPLFHGRGIFNYNVGMLPHRRAIISVVGRPIETQQNANPSESELEEVQERYIKELTRIWDKYKDVYAPGRTKELTLVQ